MRCTIIQSMVRAPAITNLLRTFWFYFQKQHSLQMVTLERPFFLPRFAFSTLPCANPWCFPSLLPILQLSLPMRNSQPVFQEKDHFGEMFPLVADWILIFFPKERPSGLKIYFIDKIWEPVWQILVGCPSGQLIDTSFCQIQFIKVPLGSLSDETKIFK